MRHYLGFNKDGVLISQEIYYGGWPPTHDLTNNLCNEPSVVSLRQSAAVKRPEITGFVGFDCECSSSKGTCDCPNIKMANCYVDLESKALCYKPTTTLSISKEDGVLWEDVNHGALINRTPGSVVKLRMTGGAPDGAVVKCCQKGNVDILFHNEMQLIFSGGATNTIDLVTPPQGNKGTIGVSGKYIVAKMLILRGWN